MSNTDFPMPKTIGEPGAANIYAKRNLEAVAEAIERPVPPPYKYTPPSPAPDTGMDIKFNGQRLVVNATVTTSVEAKQLIGALTALVPFLHNGE